MSLGRRGARRGSWRYGQSSETVKGLFLLERHHFIALTKSVISTPRTGVGAFVVCEFQVKAVEDRDEGQADKDVVWAHSAYIRNFGEKSIPIVPRAETWTGDVIRRAEQHVSEIHESTATSGF